VSTPVSDTTPLYWIALQAICELLQNGEFDAAEEGVGLLLKIIAVERISRALQ
jgi:hypothetical protein